MSRASPSTAEALPAAGLVALLVAALALLGAGSAAAAEPVATVCTLDDPRLAEVSGLAWAADGLRAVADSGNPSTVRRLGTSSPACRVAGSQDVPVDGRDVEDLARAADGTLWLADTGDNDLARSTVAVLRLPPAGGELVTRLAYPDGPHDAEALLLGTDGRPVIVTKQLGGRSGLYAPAAPLPRAAGADPVPLQRVGEVVLPPSTTVGGPVGSFGSGLVTGAAVSPDGRVAALRTYTDAWLYPVTPGPAGVGADALVTALAGPAVRVPLPGEPQGEGVALDAEGTLWSASESPSSGRGALRAVPGAAALVEQPGPTGRATAAGTAGATPVPGPPPAAAASSEAPSGGGAVALVLVAAVAVVAVAVAAALVLRSRRRG